ncbi:hypothetical protein QJS10_CPA09g00255 [Acorus calamus]|uniref:Uncharacterized protein n=1 Tax=Acorus calamus TaxID=4465 RepID=A0AAV9E506_ACOCL|nr:hypothetical protein QJS10_CPA09g00255 [Acorus calamus]
MFHPATPDVSPILLTQNIYILNKGYANEELYLEIYTGVGDCSHNIQIQQWRSGSTAENMPIYTVQMVNEGSKGVEKIMVDCGDFR